MNYLKQLRKFIFRLKVLEILKFKQFDFRSFKLWEEFAYCLTKMKNLRNLEVGEINTTLNELDEGILSLLSIPSLKEIGYYKKNGVSIF